MEDRLESTKESPNVEECFRFADSRMTRLVEAEDGVVYDGNAGRARQQADK